MGDIKTILVDITKGAQWLLDGALLAEDDSMDTAIIISLFTDRQADTDDKLPQGQTDRRGWWGDAYLPALADGMTDNLGSRLWLLDGKRTQQNLVLAKQYAEEALDWMMADSVASAVAVTASYARDNILRLEVGVTRPDGGQLRRRYDVVWGET
ncbi:MAG: phage GP46 family protein [Oxalobacter formigenes]|nr:phage GP46 family protein [Oxalobacter formigenes]